jgi:hypothetical protein
LCWCPRIQHMWAYDCIHILYSRSLFFRRILVFSIRQSAVGRRSGHSTLVVNKTILVHFGGRHTYFEDQRTVVGQVRG